MSRERISQLIEETAARLGYIVYESGVLLKGENSMISIKIDSLSGISHLDCERFSKELSARLDDADILPNYFLEVSSPGLKRLLRSGEEFGRFPGAPVKVVYDEGRDRRVVKGTIKSAGENAVTVSTESGEVTVSYGAIINANLDY